MEPTETRKVVVLGSGPAGLTAALYLARAELEPLVVGGRESGGQLMITSEVENYPGFPEGILGPELMERFRKQSERFGATIWDADAIRVRLRADPKVVVTDDGRSVEAHAVVVATGASAKWLGLPNELRLRGKGVSACATCDGYFFREKRVAVVGGGDTAMEESLFLTKFATSVTIVHRRDAFRASKIMQKRVLEHPKISVLWNTEVRDVLGKEKVEAVRLENTKERRIFDLPVEGLFVAIGHAPNTAVLKGELPLDERGYVLTGPRETLTEVPGVFVAGDVFDHRYRQAVTAAGSGCKAAIEAEKYLEERGLV